jgi:fructose-1,6-bisphosphatase I
MDNLITIEKHIQEQERIHPLATGQLSNLLYNLALAGKIINREVNRAGLINLLGQTGDVNVQGEMVAKLDDYSNAVMVSVLGQGGHVCVMGSEECEEVIFPPSPRADAKYVVHFDPLDGSSNIDANVSIGTIFSISERMSPPASKPGIEDILQPGNRMIAAGYIVYGSSTMMVYTTRDGSVDGFTLDPSVGEFLRSHRDIRMPEQCKIFSCNVGNTQYWDQGIRDYLESVVRHDDSENKPYALRYIGSLVSDFHRNLLYGGVFLYPRNVHIKPVNKGKLRLLYEANPLAMVAENAGGAASTGYGRVLDVQPEELHQRTPLFIGCKKEVQVIERFLQNQEKLTQ